MDKHTPEQRHKNMQAVKNKDSEIELLLRRELWSRGIRYQKNSNKVFGHPDIVFIGKKIAVFCDSEIWHGYNWETKKEEITTNSNMIMLIGENSTQSDRTINMVQLWETQYLQIH